ncbi:MAG: hypothetical protein RLZZ244_2710 [Verrucomicrobiota bacterium]|jgi:cell division protease FtsH
MSDFEPRNSPQRQRPGNGGDPQFNWRTLLLLVTGGLLILGAFATNMKPGGEALERSYSEFREMVERKQIVKDSPGKPLELVTEPGGVNDHLQGWMRVTEGEREVERRFRTQVNLQYNRDLREFLNKHGLEANPRVESSPMSSVLVNFLPIGFFLLVLYFLFRQQIRMAGRGAMSFGKSKAKMMSREKNRVTFKDVAGVEEAKEEVLEIVEFLRDPKKFQKLGGRIPKGVLMVGSPGTGKTLLARAIAGEADVPFFSISGSDFVEMFVGVGASRVRDMFEQGKKAAPCLIFIDEIDAVGRHRGHGMGGGHDEREQTLNALLVEMDGFDTQEGVIIIAATNRPDVLDPALLRPGRFDRQITVPLPDVKGREEILRVHSKKVKLGEDVDLAVIARGTPGYSGAELANVMNEAALMAARRGMKAISRRELEEARDKVRWGKERRSLAMSDKEKENTAYHEAGHALLGVLLENTDPVHKVTIIPRGPSLGSTMYLPVEDKYTQRKNELLDRLVMIMGGRVAEEIVFGDVTNGARGDINQATEIARRMVCEWGMSEKMGMVEYGKHEEYVFLGRDINQNRNYSEATAMEIDREVRALCDNAYSHAKELLIKHRDKLEAIAKGLLEYETLDGSHVREIMDSGSIQNPPTPPSSPSLPPPLRPRTSESAQESKGGPEMPPGLAGALA